MVDTTSAWIGKHEVVTVTFAPSAVAFRDLVIAAKSKGCATLAWTTTDAQQQVAHELLGDKATRFKGDIRRAKDSDQLYYLERSPLRFLPLTPLQARRVNGALFGKSDPAEWLSPRQGALAKRVKAALSKDTTALDGLARPADIEGLAAYTKALEDRLE